MSKKVYVLATGIVLALTSAGSSLGQETTTTTVTQTPTTVTKTVQNPDGSFTVIEYPAGKEVQVVLDPVGITADGAATILRDSAGTRIKINLNKLPAEVTTINLYAIDETGAVTSLGPATVSNGSVSFNTTTPLSKFMLIASPEATLATYEPQTKVLFRSAVPAGLAVVPRVVNPVGVRVAATTVEQPAVVTQPSTVVTTPQPSAVVTTTQPSTVVTTTQPAAVVTTTQPSAVVTTTQPVTTTVYTVPMLNIPMFQKGDETKMTVNFTGPLAGARANVFITPRKDGPTEVKVRFHDLKEVPSGKVYQVWAASPDNQFVKLGQVVNAPGRNEAEVKSEVTLPDFGLLITLEDATGDLTSPHGNRIGFVEIVK